MSSCSRRGFGAHSRWNPLHKVITVLSLVHYCTETSVCLGWLTLFLELGHVRWDSRSRLHTMLYFCAEISNLSCAAGYLLIETCWEEIFSYGEVLISSFLQNQICVWRKPMLYIVFEMDLNHCNPLHSDWWMYMKLHWWMCIKLH